MFRRNLQIGRGKAMIGSTLKTKYEADQPLATDAQFMEWIAALEKIMDEWAYSGGEGRTPYGLPLHETTGLECWHDMYRDGFTPQEAFDEDRDNW